MEQVQQRCSGDALQKWLQGRGRIWISFHSDWKYFCSGLELVVIDLLLLSLYRCNAEEQFLDSQTMLSGSKGVEKHSLSSTCCDIEYSRTELFRETVPAAPK